MCVIGSSSSCCRCCPCSSNSVFAVPRAALTLERMPFIQILLFPASLISLLKERVSSASSRPSSPRTGQPGGIENSPSIVRLSAPLRINERFPLPPESNSTAVRMIDLPAPVEPVSVLRPLPNGITASSTTARFSIFNRVSIGYGGSRRQCLRSTPPQRSFLRTRS